MGVVAAGAAALLLYNGTIRTDLRSADALAEALCTNDETIYAVGTRASVARACPDATLVDLGGATVLPGLTDAHCHVMLEAARRRHADTTWPGGAWPTKADLDGLKKPTHVYHISGHACWVNLRALALANVTKATADPPGGTIVRDAAGEPTGVLTDNAMALVEDLVPHPTAAAVRASVAAHAIGDAANRAVLDAYEAAGVAPGDRFRVEHAQILTDADLGRFAALKRR
ncbi:hydrolase [Aureococcus anophagefferens]|nr:hydrolase [Aureococcus anophagefferens]